MSHLAHRTDARLMAAAVSSSLGLVVHNLGEFGSGILFRPETLGPLLVTAALVIAVSRRPRRGVLALLAGWAALHLFVGGLSVLPLRILPFVPEQSVGHYATHVVYAAAQLPLLWASGSRLGRRERSTEVSVDRRDERSPGQPDAVESRGPSTRKRTQEVLDHVTWGRR